MFLFYGNGRNVLRMKSKVYKVIVLDFDGVILESNGIKDAAMTKLFASFTQHWLRIEAYHQSTTAIRFIKFKYIYEQILNLPYDDAIEQHLAKEFSDFCRQRLQQCPFVRGAMEFLMAFKDRCPMYVVSINPSEDLNRVIGDRGLSGFFKEVKAVNASKANAIQDIASKEGVSIEDMLFIGDSRGDYESAREVGVPFFARRGQWDFSGVDVPVFNDMQEIKEAIWPSISQHYLV